MWDCVISGGKDEKLPRPLGPVWRAVPNALKAIRPPAERPPAASSGPSPDCAATATSAASARCSPRECSAFRVTLRTTAPAPRCPVGSRIAVSAPPEDEVPPSSGCGDWKSRYGSASRRSPPLPTSEPPPTARLQKVPLPGSGDGESDSEADLFPPERHRVSTATPGQPTVTELGRQVGEAIQKLEGRRDSALNSGPITPAQSVQQLIKQIPAVGFCAPGTPSAPLPHCTTAEGAPATERR